MLEGDQECIGVAKSREYRSMTEVSVATKQRSETAKQECRDRNSWYWCSGRSSVWKLISVYRHQRCNVEFCCVDITRD